MKAPSASSPGVGAASSSNGNGNATTELSSARSTGTVAAVNSRGGYSTLTVTESGTFSITQFDDVHTLSEQTPLMVALPALLGVNGMLIEARFSVRLTFRTTVSP